MARNQLKQELAWILSIVGLAGFIFGLIYLQKPVVESQVIAYNDVLINFYALTFFPHITVLLFFVIYLLRIIRENYQNFIANLVFLIANLAILIFLIDIIIFLNTFQKEVLYAPLSALPTKNASSRFNYLFYTAIATFFVLCIFEIYVIAKTWRTIRDQKRLSY